MNLCARCHGTGHEPEGDLFAPVPTHHPPSPTERRVASAQRVHVRQQRERALAWLRDAGLAGLTHRELDTLAGWPAVTGSRRLYDLHRAGLAIRTTREREGCSVYVHPRYWREYMGRIPPRQRAA